MYFNIQDPRGQFPWIITRCQPTLLLLEDTTFLLRKEMIGLLVQLRNLEQVDS